MMSLYCEFCKTGEVLRLIHVARGVDSEGVLLLDIVVNGYVPPSLSSSSSSSHVSLQVLSHLCPSLYIDETRVFLSSSFPLPGPLVCGLLQEFDESYVQTGQGQLYSWSSQTHRRGGTPMVLRCNRTIIYEGQEERQGPVLQLLRVSGINSVYNVFALSLDFHITASLLIPGVEKKINHTMS